MMQVATQVMTASVSVVDMFRRWHESEDDFSEFLAQLESPRSKQMEAGIAFHEALENAAFGEISLLEAKGYIFDLSELEATLARPQVVELPCSRYYGSLLVRGRVDGATGATIRDYKLTFSGFDSERYADSYQWRFYLDMLKADIFEYYVFEAYDNYREGKIDVRKLNAVTMYRYPGMEADCKRLAGLFASAASKHPEIAKMRELDEL